MSLILEAISPISTSKKFSNKVSIHYIRYSPHTMDIDNLYTSFKLIGDSIKRLGIIVDDNPNYVDLRCTQVQTKDFKVKIIITEI